MLGPQATTLSPLTSSVVPQINEHEDDKGGISLTMAFVLGAIIAIVIVGAVAGALLFHRFR